MRSKGMKDLATFRAREVKKAAAEEKDEYSEGQWTVGVKVGGKIIPASFQKIEGGCSLGRKIGERRTDRRIDRWSEPRF